MSYQRLIMMVARLVMRVLRRGAPAAAKGKLPRSGRGGRRPRR